MSSSPGRLDATKHLMVATIAKRQPSLSMGVMLGELMAFPSYTKWPDSAPLEKNPTPRAEVDS